MPLSPLDSCMSIRLHSAYLIPPCEASVPTWFSCLPPYNLAWTSQQTAQAPRNTEHCCCAKVNRLHPTLPVCVQLLPITYPPHSGSWLHKGPQHLHRHFCVYIFTHPLNYFLSLFPAPYPCPMKSILIPPLLWISNDLHLFLVFYFTYCHAIYTSQCCSFIFSSMSAFTLLIRL